MQQLKYLLTCAFLFVAASCGKNFGDLNVDPNNPQTVPPEVLLTSAEKALADNLSPFNGDAAAVGDLLAQSWTKNNYTGFTRYGFDGSLFNGWFANLYAGALEDLAEIQNIVARHPGLDAAQDQNRIAIAKILQVYTFQVLTDCFGPVPYTEALQGAGNRSPRYDSQKDIYLGLLDELHTAIALLDESTGSFGSADVIYGGDVTKWKKFAHWLILRIAIRVADTELGATAQQEVEAAAAFAVNNLSGNGDNAYFHYLPAQPNNTPYNKQRIERGDADLGLSDILIDKTLKPLNDPRLSAFADERVDGGGYFGRPYGQNDDNAAGDVIGNYSQPSGAAVIREGRSNFKPTDVLRPDAGLCFMNYAEVCFILAEARERGWNVPGGAAADWYHEGIRASMEEWGVEASAAAAYLAQLDVAYGTAPGNWQQKVGVQKWLALFMQGIQAWIEWRRLDFNKLERPVDGTLLDFPQDKIAPLRLPYPFTEQGVNGDHYREAVQTLLGGPDKMSTRVWWDVY
jgi:hypothetical protein